MKTRVRRDVSPRWRARVPVGMPQLKRVCCCDVWTRWKSMLERPPRQTHASLLWNRNSKAWRHALPPWSTKKSQINKKLKEYQENADAIFLPHMAVLHKNFIPLGI